MNLLDKANITPFSFLVLPDDFEISDEPQIIFAPNGTGKTTLFKILIGQNSEKCEIYTYDSSNEPVYKVMGGKRKKLSINVLTKNYSIEEEKRDAELNTLSPKEALKIAYSGKTQATLKKCVTNENILKVIEDNVYTLCNPLDDEDKMKLRYVLPYFEDVKKLISEKSRLASLTDAQKEADIETMKMMDRKPIYTSYNIEEHKSDIESEGCPLCGNKSPDVYDKILAIRQNVLDAKFEFFQDFEFLKKLPSGVSAIEAINITIEGILGLSEEKVLHLLMTRGNPEEEAKIQRSITNYNSAVEKIAFYIEERDAAYAKMSSSREAIEKFFPAIYPKSSIVFDDSEKQIIINTAREPATYSEGEKHEMYATIRELAILGSDKEIVIADDPLTELDAANEYRNVFRFVRLAQDHNKKVIVFTCNPNFINIANEYCPSLFKYYYLVSNADSAHNALSLKLLKMDFHQNGGMGAFISLEQCVASANDSDLSSKVVRLINERAELYIKKTDRDRMNEISKFLHYDGSITITASPDAQISNDNLYDLIEGFTSLPNYNSFSQLARDRVCYLAALRIFVEKKLYLYQQERLNRGLGDCFPPSSKPYLAKDKIRKVDEIIDSFKITDFYSKWDRQALMCLKTMLNDNDHPYSFVLPVSYAISLGNDSISSEILSVKEMFS